MGLSKEEKKAIEYLKDDIKSYVYLLNNDDKQKDYYIKEHPNMEAKRILLNLVERQQKETEDYKKFKKDIVSKIMIWDKEELPDNEVIISMLDTFVAEVSRLEDIEDKKVEVAVDFIEAKRDKFWQDKIREKIKKLKKRKDISQVVGSIVILEELLEDNKNESKM